MTATELAWALLRTTLATSAAAIIAWLLLAWFHVASTRVHRTAWALVILQGWLIVPWTFEIETPLAQTLATPDVIVNDEGRGRESFATSSLQLLEPRQSQKTPDPIRVASIPLIAWSIGGATLIGIRLRRYITLLRSIPQLRLPTQRPWTAEWRRLRRTGRVKRTDLLMTNAIGPLVCWAYAGRSRALSRRVSAWRYLILAPQSLWQALASNERQAILRHELAHIERGDLWKSLAIRILALPQWFNPFARLAVRRFDEAGEWACDDAAAGHATDRLTLANSLLRATELALTPLPGALHFRGGTLSRRIQRLVNPRFKEESIMQKLVIFAALALIVVGQMVRVEYITADDGVANPSTIVKASAEIPATESQPAAYIIEPPDVLRIKLLAGSPRRGRDDASQLQKLAQKQSECLVYSEGRINPFGLGRVYVAGMTLDLAAKAVEAKLSDHFDQPDVEVSLVSGNSKVAYVIYRWADDRDMVDRYTLPHPITDAVNVGSILKRWAKPGGYSERQLAECEIYVSRDNALGENMERLPVVWEASTASPSSETNWRLRPGDRIFVVSPKLSPEARSRSDAAIDWRVDAEAEQAAILAEYRDAKDQSQASNPKAIRIGASLLASPDGSVIEGAQLRIEPRFAEGAPEKANDVSVSARPHLVPAAPQDGKPPEGAETITFKIEIIEDLHDNLAEFDSLRAKQGSFIGDSETILGTIRILEKNDLIRVLSRPQILSQFDRPARVTIEGSGSEAPDQRRDLEVEAGARRVDGRLFLSASVSVFHDGQPHTSTIDSPMTDRGQTIVVQALTAMKKRDASKPAPIYVVVTPSVIDRGAQQRAKATLESASQREQ